MIIVTVVIQLSMVGLRDWHMVDVDAVGSSRKAQLTRNVRHLW